MEKSSRATQFSVCLVFALISSSFGQPTTHFNNMRVAAGQNPDNPPYFGNWFIAQTDSDAGPQITVASGGDRYNSTFINVITCVPFGNCYNHIDSILQPGESKFVAYFMSYHSDPGSDVRRSQFRTRLYFGPTNSVSSTLIELTTFAASNSIPLPFPAGLSATNGEDVITLTQFALWQPTVFNIDRSSYGGPGGDGYVDYVMEFTLFVTRNLVPIEVANQPTDQVVNAHDTASFVVSVTNSPVWSYQWLFNGTNMPGATSSLLRVTNVTPADLGTYAVVMANGFGAVVSSNAVLSMPPHLDKSFTGLMAYWGKDAELGVEAWGTGPLRYQWFKDGVAVSGGTDAKLVIPAIQFTNAGLYSVVVGNDFGSATNAPAQVVVNPAGVGFGLYPGVMVRGVVGYTYSIQASAGLSDTNTWTTLATWTLSQPEQLWIDTFTDASAATNRQRFYRVVPGQ